MPRVAISLQSIWATSQGQSTYEMRLSEMRLSGRHCACTGAGSLFEGDDGSTSLVATGSIISATVDLNQMDKLYVVVGQVGGPPQYPGATAPSLAPKMRMSGAQRSTMAKPESTTCAAGAGNAPGGSGGTFVWLNGWECGRLAPACGWRRWRTPVKRFECHCHRQCSRQQQCL